MDAQEATRSFKQAEALYSAGRHEEALQILENLDLHFPNTKNILYPKALCLAALGKQAQASAACDALEALQDPRAQSIRAKLQPAPAEDDLGLGLEVNLLDDFDKPAPKRAPVAVQSSSKTPLVAGVAGAVALVVVIAGLVYSGALGKLLPKRETVEGALAQIGEVGKSTTACSGLFTAEGNLTQPMPMKLTISGDFDFLMKDNKPLFLVNVTAIMENMGGMSQSFKMVSDGTTMYQEMNMMGKAMVMKMPIPADAGAGFQFNPSEFLNKIKEFGEISLQKDQMIDDMPAYVFLIKPSPTLKMPEGMPKLSSIKVIVVKETAMPGLIEVTDETGAVLLKASTARVVMNSPSSPDKFNYTPPAGAQVMDMNAAKGMMPFPMPGM